VQFPNTGGLQAGLRDLRAEGQKGEEVVIGLYWLALLETPG